MKWDKIDLPLKKCSETIFNTSDTKTYERLNIGNHYCTSMRNYTVRGNFIAPNFDYLEFRFSKCVNTTLNGNSCETSANIDSVIGGAFFNLWTISSYVDFNDFSTPIKKFIDEQYYWDLSPIIRLKTDLYLWKSYAYF